MDDLFFREGLMAHHAIHLLGKGRRLKAQNDGENREQGVNRAKFKKFK